MISSLFQDVVIISNNTSSALVKSNFVLSLEWSGKLKTKSNSRYKFAKRKKATYIKICINQIYSLWTWIFVLIYSFLNYNKNPILH